MTPEQDPLAPLFDRYRNACTAVDASADFMPQLWNRIDSRRSLSWKVRVYARGIVTAAATVCLAIAAFQLSPFGAAGSLFDRTYLEALEEDHAPEAMAYSGGFQFEIVPASVQSGGSVTQ